MSKNKQIMEMAKNLRIKAGVMAMGERIEWGSDTALMEEAAALLETLITAALEPQWLPIESAPKDGSLILSWSEGASPVAHIAQWKNNAWRGDHYGDREPYWYFSKLTHWMPLPAVPATEGER